MKFEIYERLNTGSIPSTLTTRELNLPWTI